MAKFTEEKVRECAKWVEKNGLYPQHCGAPVKDFCSAMHIDFKTYKEWCKKSTFSDAIENARAIFKSDSVVEVTNALKKKALGFTYTEESQEAGRPKITEYDPKTGKKVKEYYGELQTLKAVRKTVTVAPDTAAGIFLLTNIEPDRWKNMRFPDQTVQGQEPPRELTPKEAAAFRKELEKKY